MQKPKRDSCLSAEYLLASYKSWSQEKERIPLYKCYQNLSEAADSPSLNTSGHPGLFFLKPEIFKASYRTLENLFDFILRSCNKHEIHITSVAFVSGERLAVSNFFDVLYGKKLFYAREIDFASKRIGGCRLVNLGASPEDIFKSWITSKAIVELETDCHAAPYNFENNQVFLLNGFVPYQRSLYNALESQIILFTFKSHLSFKLLKKHFQGSLSLDQVDTIRSYIYKNKNLFLPFKISPSLNGFHLSENHTEGHKEVELYKLLFTQKELS